MRHIAPARGNALFIVLIGVFLFAAFSFAITRNMGGSTTLASGEEARLLATEMIDYGNALRPIIDRMMLLAGVKDTNTSGKGILFAHADAPGAYGVPGTQPTTELFHSSGGKATYLKPPPAACLGTCRYEFSGQYIVTGVGLDSKEELAMLVIDIPKAVCEKINTILGTGWSSIPSGGINTIQAFNGTNYGVTGATLAGVFTGKRAFCLQKVAGAQPYVYLHVIRAR